MKPVENPVSLETATADVEKWLDAKKVGQKKRETRKREIEALIGAIEEGTIILQDDNTLLHKLKFPVGESKISELTYKSRIDSTQLHVHLKNAVGYDERLVAHVCALTSQPKGVIKALDSEDMDVAGNIGLFFT